MSNHKINKRNNEQKPTQKNQHQTRELYVNDFEDTNHMARQLRSVIKSLCDQDGYYDLKTADTIGNMIGKHSNMVKDEIELRKLEASQGVNTFNRNIVLGLSLGGDKADE